jgi:tRNA pseudouridine65 synthase
MRAYFILYYLLVHLPPNVATAFLGTYTSISRDSCPQLLGVIPIDQHDNAVTNQEESRKRKHKKERIPILQYKDNYVMVSKPAGVSIHRNVPNWGHAAKSPALEKLVKKQLARKPYLVHRLDHRTSGAVILGFDSNTAANLHGRLRDNAAVKLYVALVRGDLRDRFERDGHGKGLTEIIPKCIGGETNFTGREIYGKITVDLPIQLDNETQKEARTDFYFLSSVDLNDEDHTEYELNQNKVPFTNKAVTLLLCHPRTGRTHQIRRHLRKALQSPIIGDSEHGDSRVNRFWRETIGLDRLGLHCWYLELPSQHSKNAINNERESDEDRPIQCIAPLTTDFASALQHEALKQLWVEALQMEPRLNMEPYDDRGGARGRNYQNRKSESNNNDAH